MGTVARTRRPPPRRRLPHRQHSSRGRAAVSNGAPVPERRPDRHFRRRANARPSASWRLSRRQGAAGIWPRQEERSGRLPVIPTSTSPRPRCPQHPLLTSARTVCVRAAIAVSATAPSPGRHAGASRATRSGSGCRSTGAVGVKAVGLKLLVVGRPSHRRYRRSRGSHAVGDSVPPPSRITAKRSRHSACRHHVRCAPGWSSSSVKSLPSAGLIPACVTIRPRRGGRDTQRSPCWPA